jgi:putative restriction endonuclease
MHAKKDVQIGDTAYAFKQGKDPRGIFGVGTIVDGPADVALKTDGGLPRRRVLIRFSQLVDPTKEFLRTLEELQGVLPSNLINANASGTKIPEDVAVQLRELLMP